MVLVCLSGETILDKHLITPFLHPLKPLATGLAPRGTLRRPLDCLLCDIYGTLLISSSGDMGASRAQMLQDEKIRPLVIKYNLSVTALELRERLTQVIQQHHDRARKRGIDYPEVRIEQIWSQILSFPDLEAARQFALEFEMLVNPIWPMPHVNELLRTCRKHGVQLGIISNGQFFTPLLLQWLLEGELAELGFNPDLTFFSYVHGHAKPSSILFEMAAKRLAQQRISTRRTAYIGNDMRNDIVPAMQQGYQSVLFAGDARSLQLRQEDPQCRNVQPDLVVTNLKELISYVQPR